VLPGGTVLVFDNGRAVGRSRVLGIDPISGQIVWQFSASPPESMFSAIAGGCEELPGGTILISDAQGGRGIEVTRDGRTAWTVHISTLKSSSDTSRAEFYRMSAVLADTAGLLGESDGPIRELARSRLRCEPRDASACLSSTL
jgi:outer membrane protein assembly factor BamB